MSEYLVNIAVPSTVNRLFTYLLPSVLSEKLLPGQRCVVPFGRRKVIGYFVEPVETKPDVPLKPVLEILERTPLYNKELYDFLRWMAGYYFCNPADVFNAAIPPGLRKIKKPDYIISEKFAESLDKFDLPVSTETKFKTKKLLRQKDINRLKEANSDHLNELIDREILRPSWAGAESVRSGILLGYRINESANIDSLEIPDEISRETRTFPKKDFIEKGVSNYKFNKMVKDGVIMPVYGLPDLFDYFQPRAHVERLIPNKDQQKAIDTVIDFQNGFAPFLLYGITGSGKTLVYCHIARQILKAGKTVLVLVPEIALAGTQLSYFKSFFGDDIALLHSGLKPTERILVWQNIRIGKYKIVIGARSAIFAPLENIGLIIVDEEHDESYKQDEPVPRFQARDAAVMRARMAGVPIILGSATPSLESFHNADNGRYTLLKLTRRPEEAEIPVIRLVDLKKERPAGEQGPFFTDTIISKINQSLNENHQVILYLNRRGFSPRIKCGDCGHTPECPQCNISLTYHKSGKRLMCHFCGYVNAHYHSCSNCSGDNFIYLGAGTQKIEDTITGLVEGGRIIRLDSDSAGRDKAHIILSEFAAQKYNILLGTQMVTKGIDFPDVSLVGVLMADIGLDMPDFRASEKLFARLIQVAGRSGRGIIPGEVVIQTYNPDIDLIDDAARQDYDTFYQREISSRKLLQYPPFSHLINFRFSSKTETTAVKSSLDFRNNLESRLHDTKIRVQILGPAPCPLYRLRGMYRRQMLVKTGQIIKFIRFLKDWDYTAPNFGISSKVRLTVDIDPYDMM